MDTKHPAAGWKQVKALAALACGLADSAHSNHQATIEQLLASTSMRPPHNNVCAPCVWRCCHVCSSITSSRLSPWGTCPNSCPCLGFVSKIGEPSKQTVVCFGFSSKPTPRRVPSKQTHPHLAGLSIRHLSSFPRSSGLCHLHDIAPQGVLGARALPPGRVGRT